MTDTNDKSNWLKIPDKTTDITFRHFVENNQGWEYIANKYGNSDGYMDDIRQFEQRFNRWQKQAILFIEITYAKDYTYLSPIGVFTHIGTLARAIQNIFEPEWKVSCSLVGDVLYFSVDKGIKDSAHSYCCRFVELDQTNSSQCHEGWKF